MMRNRPGFTFVEMVFVLLLSALVIGIGARGYSAVMNRMAVANARDALITTVYRARSEAMRTGRVVRVTVLPDSGAARATTNAGTVLHSMSASDYSASMIGAQLSVCYTSRGYALPGCTNFNGQRAIAFIRGTDTAAVAISPLGQIRRQ